MKTLILLIAAAIPAERFPTPERPESLHFAAWTYIDEAEWNFFGAAAQASQQVIFWKGGDVIAWRYARVVGPPPARGHVFAFNDCDKIRLIWAEKISETSTVPFDPEVDDQKYFPVGQREGLK